MSRSPFRLLTSGPLIPLVVLGGVLTGGCGDDGGDTCGPGAASSSDLVASNADLTLTYESLTSLVGNDCPAADAPAGVISVSIEGHQLGDDTQRFTICIPRPDLLNTGGRTLGTSQSMADVRIFDVSGIAGGCTYALDSTVPPTGTVSGMGVCENGDSTAGFALEFDGTVSLARTCGATIDTVSVSLAGTIAVARRS